MSTAKERKNNIKSNKQRSWTVFFHQQKQRKMNDIIMEMIAVMSIHRMAAAK